MTQPIVPIEEQVTPVEPTVFDTLVAHANEPSAIAVTPSVVATEIQDEATLSSKALALSSTANLLPSATTADLPVEAASIAAAPTASEFERLLNEGFSVPHIAEQLAMTVSNFEQTTGHPVLDVAG